MANNFNTLDSVTDEIAYASITANSANGSTGSGANITGLSVTYTADGTSAYYLEVEGIVAILHTDYANVSVRALESGSARLSSLISLDNPGAAASTGDITYHPLYKRVRLVPSAGSHTYQVNLLKLTAAATTNLQGTTAQPFSISVRRA